MTIAFRDTLQSATTDTVNHTNITGLTAGDVYIEIAHNTGGGAAPVLDATYPFTAISTGPDAVGRNYTYGYRKATGSETGLVTTGFELTDIFFALTGVDQTTPVESFQGPGTFPATDKGRVAASTPTADNCWHVVVYADTNSGSTTITTPPSGYTLLAGPLNKPGQGTLYAYYKDLGAASSGVSTGAVDAQWSAGGGFGIAAGFIIKAAAGGSPAVEGSRRRRTNFRPGDKGTFSFGLGRFFQSRAANASNGIKAALPSSGALVGQLGGVAGTATHSAAAGAHPTSGALTGQLGGVAGSAAHATLHATSGALTGQIGGVGASAVRGIIPPTSRRKGGMWVKGKPPAPKPDAFADSLHRPFTPPAPVADAPEAESVVSPPPVNVFAAPSLAQALAELRIPPKPPSPHAPPRVRPAVEIPADILALLAKLK